MIKNVLFGEQVFVRTVYGQTENSWGLSELEWISYKLGNPPLA